MKKLLFLLASTALFMGCSKEDENNGHKGVSISFYSYSQFTPTSPLTKVNAKFFLFNANNGQKYMEERIENPNGDYFEYSNLNCEMLTFVKNTVL